MEEQFFVGEGDTVTLGSSSECTINLSGGGVAPIHAALTRSQGKWQIVDLGSSLGTIVDGEPIRERTLEAGNLITLGTAQLRVVEGDQIVPVNREGISESVQRLVPADLATSRPRLESPEAVAVQPASSSNGPDTDLTGGRRPSRRRWGWIAAGASAVLILGVGGGAVAYTNHQEQEKREQAAAKAAAAEQVRRQAEAELQAAKAACEEEVSESLEALRGIQSMVNVGVSYSSYEPLLVDAANSVGSLDEQMDPSCQAVVTALNKAFREYGKASKIWNRYIYDDVGSTAQLQGRWALADLYLSEAETALSEWQTEPGA